MEVSVGGEWEGGCWGRGGGCAWHRCSVPGLVGVDEDVGVVKSVRVGVVFDRGAGARQKTKDRKTTKRIC